MEASDGGAQRRGLTVRVAVPREPGDSVEILPEPRGGRGEWGLVRVQSYVGVDLRRVVARQFAEVGTHRHKVDAQAVHAWRR